HCISREESIPPAHLSSSLDQLSADLARYDAEIARLTSHRKVLQNLHDTGRSLFTPIRRLPVEILTDIFRRIWIDFQLAYSAGDSWHTYGRGRTPFGLLLAAVAPLLDVSGVCVRWHAIAMSTPELWTDIWVGKVHAHGSKTLPIAKGLLQLALERSRDLPLRIHVRNHLEWGADRDKSLLDNEALNLLSKESSRWKTAEFDCLQEDILNCDVQHRMPLLEHLDLSKWRDDASTGNILDRFRDCHHLKTVSFPAEIDASMLPLEQLSFARIARISLDQITTALHYLPRLSASAWLGTEVALDDDEDTLSLPATTSNATALVLHSFAPDGMFSVKVLVGVLSSLTLPRLHTLTLEHNIDVESPTAPALHTAFIGLAQRSDFGVHLRRLNLRLAVLNTDTALLGILSAVRGLEVLVLGDGYPRDEPSSSDDNEPVRRPRPSQPLLTQMLFSRLSHCDPAGSDTFELVPRLQTFTYAYARNFDVGAFLDFVHARANTPRKEPFAINLEGRTNERGFPHQPWELKTSKLLQRLTEERKLRYRYRPSGPRDWLFWQNEDE
ncbi:hypothetical protein C8F01DRAFT_1112458, partial [Mycena amicta]